VYSVGSYLCLSSEKYVGKKSFDIDTVYIEMLVIQVFEEFRWSMFAMCKFKV